MQKLRLVIFILVIQAVLLWGHFFAYQTIAGFFHLSARSSNNLFWVMFMLSFSFLAASLFTYRFYGSLGRAFYQAAAIWLGTFYWLFWACLISAFVYLSGEILYIDTGILESLGRLLIMLAIPVSLYGLYNTRQTKIKKIDVKLNNLPSAWQGRRAVMLADTHLGNFRNLKFIKKIVRLINAQNPEIVFISGDYYDGPPADLTNLALPLKDVKAPLGIYFCPGNHEEFGDPSPFFQALKAADVKVLNNELLNIDGVQIMGISFSSGARPESQAKIMSRLNIKKGMPGILLKHEPSHIQVAENFGIALQLSGHTHLGQVFPLNFLTQKIYGRFRYGLQKLNQTQVYTTAGAGTWGPPQRVGNHPEIVVITFK